MAVNYGILYFPYLNYVLVLSLSIIKIVIMNVSFQQLPTGITDF